MEHPPNPTAIVLSLPRSLLDIRTFEDSETLSTSRAVQYLGPFLSNEKSDVIATHDFATCAIS
jgi:hypothetical protein